jgi:polyisoprenyl-phosphate glycosyltransferase
MEQAIPQLSIVIPLFNEEQVFETLINSLNSTLYSSSIKCEVVLVDDGSSDNTSRLIRELCIKDSRYQGILLSRNHGHQLALTAGMAFAKGSEGIMVMDGDLQDPPELIETFYKKMKEGYDVVYAIRTKRKEPVLKKAAYWLYYRIQKLISSFNIPIDSGDFGMMSRRVVDQLNLMPENSRYLRGMRSWVGFKQIGITYERSARQAGESSYSFKQLLGLAYNGIFNFSEIPVKFITRTGFITIILSLLYLGITLYKKIFLNEVPEGFTALIMAIVLFSGVQLISLGIIGEYVLRIFFQVKNRPLYIVSSRFENQEEK